MSNNKDSFWGIDLFGCATAVIAAFFVAMLLMAYYVGNEGGGVETITMDVVVTLTGMPYESYEDALTVPTIIPVPLRRRTAIPTIVPVMCHTPDPRQPRNCDQAVEWGFTQQQANRFSKFDRDKDGVSCESNNLRVGLPICGRSSSPSDDCWSNNYCCLTHNYQPIPENQITCTSEEDYVRGWCEYQIRNNTGMVDVGDGISGCACKMLGNCPGSGLRGEEQYSLTHEEITSTPPIRRVFSRCSQSTSQLLCERVEDAGDNCARIIYAVTLKDGTYKIYVTSYENYSTEEAPVVPDDWDTDREGWDVIYLRPERCTDYKELLNGKIRR